ncbi:helix-turn-helix transcriptional regulator [Kitasatospora sp. NPDC002040]|uniref:helix-turn-helix domain-containing protein n=1 Tax=Kitasatospora sp. NPDC002040 TaxID=3154661 RepID=UPI00331F91F2
MTPPADTSVESPVPTAPPGAARRRPAPRDDADERRALADRIRAARHSLRASQDTIARAAGVSRTAVSKIESAHRGVQALELRRLATALRTSPDWLLGLADEGLPDLAALHPDDRRSALLYAEFLLWLANRSLATARPPAERCGAPGSALEGHR